MDFNKLLKNKLCDHCLGRQTAQLLTGYTNRERGHVIRTNLALMIDFGEKFDGNWNNFYGISFRNKKVKSKKEPCYICNDLFDKLVPFISKIKSNLLGLDFNTFLIGTKPTKEILKREEKIWEENGIEWTEPLKSDFNRTLGTIISKEMMKNVDLEKPDVVVLVDLATNRVSYSVNPVYIYGEYNKLKRGIPQTKWPSKKYKTSVEEIIAKDFMKKMKGKGHKFHGAGREDIDAKCLGWRPFILEITEPEIRNINLKEIKIGAGVEVRKLKITDNKAPEKVKTLDSDKTYRALTVFEKTVTEDDLKKLRQLNKKVILQETPIRVKHRRADKIRKRTVHYVKFEQIGPRTIEFKIKAESGTYIKELISGDKGRTYPSISQILENKGICKELDVLAFSK